MDALAAAFAALVALAANASQWQPYGLTDRPAPAIAALPGTSGPMFVFNAGAAYAAYSPDAGATSDR
mgnify:CR=1 FL=1